MITDIEMEAMGRLISNCSWEKGKEVLGIMQDMLGDLDTDEFYAMSEEEKEDFIRPYAEKLNKFLENKKEEPEKNNTKISYLYRDADNYKVHNEQVVKGVFTEEQKEAIFDSLECGEHFIPRQVGLPEKRFDKLDFEVDHCWFELDEDAFSETNDEPTVEITAEELVKAFSECKDNWNDFDFSWMAELDFEGFVEGLCSGMKSLESRMLEAEGKVKNTRSNEKNVTCEKEGR